MFYDRGGTLGIIKRQANNELLSALCLIVLSDAKLKVSNSWVITTWTGATFPPSTANVKATFAKKKK